MNNHERENMIETINRYLKRCTVKQLRTVLHVLYELTKDSNEEDAA